MNKRLAYAVALAAMVSPVMAENNEPGSHFITNWDINEDGVVSLDDIKSRRGDIFLTFDADEDGAIDAEEYTYFDDARANDMENNPGHGKGMKRASEGMTLAFNDVDGNGEVSRDEFLSKSGDWLALLDRNGDGEVSPADFGRQ